MIVPTFITASSLRFNDVAASRINDPLVELIVFPSIVILSTVKLPPSSAAEVVIAFAVLIETVSYTHLTLPTIYSV